MRFRPSNSRLEPFEVGRDSITPIEPIYKYKGDFPFTGTIEKIPFDLK
jgi:arylsulfatase